MCFRSLIGNMKTALMDMGMEDAFKSGVANFQGINGGNDLWLSEFSQLNQVTVSGEETAAKEKSRRRSFLSLFKRRNRQLKEYRMHFERQFMYAVRHNPSGLILHIGRYFLPEKKRN